jgi:hypothetical protein
MPAKDRHHDTVKRALIKDGWTITDEQATLPVEYRNLYIDIEATQSQTNLIIFVEVKELGEVGSAVEALANAVGKYVLYRVALDLRGQTDLLYIAVTEAAYRGILSEALGKNAVARLNIPLIIFDPVREVIVRWIHLNKL